MVTITNSRHEDLFEYLNGSKGKIVNFLYCNKMQEITLVMTIFGYIDKFFVYMFT